MYWISFFFLPPPLEAYLELLEVFLGNLFAHSILELQANTIKEFPLLKWFHTSLDRSPDPGEQRNEKGWNKVDMLRIVMRLKWWCIYLIRWVRSDQRENGFFSRRKKKKKEKKLKRNSGDRGENRSNFKRVISRALSHPNGSYVYISRPPTAKTLSWSPC